MHTVKFDFKAGAVLIDSTLIAVDEEGALAKPIAKLCSPPIQIDVGRSRYRLSRKANVYGKSIDVVIEVGERRVRAVTFLFELTEFFAFTILESKILKACEKSSGVNFLSNHPSTAFSDSAEWGQAKFTYDAKQGDLSLDITFLQRSPVVAVGSS